MEIVGRKDILKFSRKTFTSLWKELVINESPVLSSVCFTAYRSQYISCFFPPAKCQVMFRGLCISVVSKSVSEGVFCTVTVNVCSLNLKFFSLWFNKRMLVLKVTIYNCKVSLFLLVYSIFKFKICFGDPWHFCVDPDPGLWLFSSFTFQTPTKHYFSAYYIYQHFSKIKSHNEVTK
jgi:hypothetical protein